VIGEVSKRLDFLLEKFLLLTQSFFERKLQKLAGIRVEKEIVLRRIGVCEQKFLHASELLESGVLSILESAEVELKNLEKLLVAHHYQKILQRGFACVRDENGEVISSLAQVFEGKKIVTEVADGEFSSVVGNAEPQLSFLNPDPSLEPSIISTKPRFCWSRAALPLLSVRGSTQSVRFSPETSRI
jgi:exonuclease VII large subunit